MKLFEHSTYLKVIEAFIQTRKTLGNPITYQEIAEGLRIQKSYLSKVMAGNANLNKDQAFLLSKLMKLNKEEKKFLFLLVEKERAALKDYREELEREIKVLQHNNTQSSSYLTKQKRKTSSAAEQTYYLYPEIQLIHLSFGLERFQKSPNLLMKELGVGESLFQRAIKTLEELRLIEVEEDRVKLLESNLHLPNDSDLFHQWQTQFKLKSIEWSKKVDPSQKYNFVASFTADEEDKEKIRLEFMKFLKKTEAIVKDANSQGLYQINFDLFQWF